jgi:O-Antigen ligase
MGGPACLWLGARRTGHAALNACAYPAFGLLVVTLLLASSRGALLVLGLGCAFWFAVVPLRLRAVAVLAAGGFAGLSVALWAFGQDALSRDQVPLAQRAAAGHDLGILVVAMLLILLIAGWAVGFALAERAPSPAVRRQLGVAVLACIALVPVGVAGLLATSPKGFGGTISSGWRNLTDPNARTPPNDPSRLSAAGSVRARYWDEALKIWRTDEAVGVGAGGYSTARPRFRRDTINVRQAHGYVVQTLSDLGVVGLLLNLAVLAAWLAAAGRNTGLWGRFRRAPYTPERVGLLTMVAIVLIFGIHSAIDWTWIIPGNVVPALLLAGWVAGRGPVAEPLGVRPALRTRLRAAGRRPLRVAGAVVILAVAGIAAWTTYQPLRSSDAADDALVAVEANDLTAARADVARARSADPLSTSPLYAGAAVEERAGNDARARALYEQAVRKEPASSESWLRLGQFELDRGDPRAALRALGPALYLDSRSQAVQLLWLQASRAELQRRQDARRAKRNP